jgi:hypothetical protein
MGYSRKNTKKGKRRMRKTFSKKNVNTNSMNRNSMNRKRVRKTKIRRRGGCTSCTNKKNQRGGDCVTGVPTPSESIYEYTTSIVPYRN